MRQPAKTFQDLIVWHISLSYLYINLQVNFLKRKPMGLPPSLDS